MIKYKKKGFKKDMRKHLELSWAGEYECPPTHKCGPGIRSTYIIHYVLSGRGYFTANGKTVDIGEHCAFIIYKGETVEYHAERSDPWHYVWIEFDGELSDELIKKTGFSREDRVTPPIDKDTILDIFREIRSSFLNSSSELEQLSCMLKFIAEIAKAFPDNEREDIHEILSDRAMALIKKSFRSMDCRVDRISELLGVSRSRLFRAMKEKYGISPKECIDKLRIDFAKQLLAGGNVSVSEACYSSGFSDPLYFSALFKRKTGFSPSEFRERSGM